MRRNYNTPPRLDPTDNKEEALDALQVGREDRAKVFAILALVDELRAIRGSLTPPQEIDDEPLA